ncbi:hypothetical protein ACJX0J_016222, partial [Zea mays]
SLESLLIDTIRVVSRATFIGYIEFSIYDYLTFHIKICDHKKVILQLNLESCLVDVIGNLANLICFLEVHIGLLSMVGISLLNSHWMIIPKVSIALHALVLIELD